MPFVIHLYFLSNIRKQKIALIAKLEQQLISIVHIGRFFLEIIFQFLNCVPLILLILTLGKYSPYIFSINRFMDIASYIKLTITSELLSQRLLGRTKIAKVNHHIKLQYFHQINKRLGERQPLKNNPDKDINTILLVQDMGKCIGRHIIQKFTRCLLLNLMEDTRPVWGKLVPLCRGMNTHALKQSKIVIGRNLDCHVVINQKRLSAKHCLIQVEGIKIFLTDTSTNGTFIEDKKINKGVRIEVKDQTQIWLLPSFRVPMEETIGFKLILLGDFRRDYLLALGGHPEIKQVDKKNQAFLNSLKQQITCPYCFQIMIYPISIQPCSHRMCGCCLTELVRNKIDECIICRAKMDTAARDPSFNSIIDEYLRSNPKQARKSQQQVVNIFGHVPQKIKNMILELEGKDAEEQETKKKAEEIQRNKVEDQLMEGIDMMEVEQKEQDSKKRRTTTTKKETKKKDQTPLRLRTTSRNKRLALNTVSSDISAETDEQLQGTVNSAPECSECTEERNGFKCRPGQPHIKCHNCSKTFAIRHEPKLYQSCEICHSYFCNLYKPQCQKNGPKLMILQNRGSTCKIQPIFFRNNKVQMDAFKNLLISQKKSIIKMFQEMLQLIKKGRFQYLQSRKILRNYQKQQSSIKLSVKSPICDNCWRQLWFQMIFIYVQNNRDLMPQTIKNRPPCYWGVNCRTMEHNIEHAKKYCHLVYQSKSI